MIYGPFSKYIDSAEAKVAPGAVIDAEGMVLVRAKAGQSLGVMPSTGGTAEVFAGFSIAGTSAAPFMEAFANKQEQFTVGSTGRVSLQFAPIPTQVLIFNVDTQTAVPATGLTITGKNISGLTAGDHLVITYKYTLDVVQARSLQGDVQPGGYSGAYIGQIGLLKRGVIFTSEFDASRDWFNATSVKAGAGGQVQDQNGTGIDLPAVIIAVPTNEVTYLGLEFSAV